MATKKAASKKPPKWFLGFNSVLIQVLVLIRLYAFDFISF
jgi:hypothetical protein